MQFLTLIVVIILLASCTSITHKPPAKPAEIRSIAFFSLRNSSMEKDQIEAISVTILNKLRQQNPHLKIITSLEAEVLLSKAKLFYTYQEFLEHYDSTLVPNPKIVKKIGAVLKADAIMQGGVFDIYQIKSQYGVSAGKTLVTVRYTLFSTQTGQVVWETTRNAKKVSGNTLDPTPSLYEVLMIAHNEILSDVPKLK